MNPAHASVRGRPWAAPLAVLFALLLVAAACGGDDDSGRRGDGTTVPDTASGPTATSDSTIATQPSSGAPLPLGTYAEVGPSKSCVAGADQCVTFTITCPGLQQPAPGEFDVRNGQGTPKGVVMLFTSAGGTSWWLEDNPQSAPMVQDLQAAGLTVVAVRWDGGSWLLAAPGEDAGTARTGCRPATIVQWVHDNLYAPMGASPGTGHCGFCIAGVSGGASEVAYPLAFYGQDQIVDVAVMVSGPPHADEAKGCIHTGDDSYWYQGPNEIQHIDESYGFINSTDGPCARGDVSFTSRWQQESAATGGNDYDYPNTRLEFLFGNRDQTAGVAQGQLFMDRVTGAGSPTVAVQTVDMPHGLNPKGFDALGALLLA